MFSQPLFVLLLLVVDGGQTTISFNGGPVCEPTSGLCFWYPSTASMHYSDADAACASDGGVVAIVDTLDVFEFVKTGIDNDGINDDVLVGAKDDIEEDIWLWPNNRQLCYNKWQTSQPGGGLGQNCLVINDNFVFEDKSCTDSFKPLCSTTNETSNRAFSDACSGVGANATNSFCDAASGQCFWFDRTVGAITNEAAKAACAQHNDGSLANLDSQVVFEAVVPHFQEIGLLLASTVVWVGGSDVVDETIWIWPSGRGLCYNKWDSGDPDGSDCMVVSGDPSLKDRSCNDNYRALCSYYEGSPTSPSNDCDAVGSDLSNPLCDAGSAYCFWFNGTASSWDEAASTCQQRGGTLANLAKSSSYQTFVPALFSTFGLVKLWVGLSDSGEEGAWQWPDGNATKCYSAWESGHPTRDSSLNCAAVNLDHKYEEHSCDTKFMFICSILMGVDTDTEECYDAENPKCDSETGECFWYGTDTSDYEGAVVECAKNNGFVAILDNVTKFTFAVSLLPDDFQQVWVGATDEAVESAWVWPNGKRLTYDKWTQNQPNEGDTQQCLMIDNSRTYQDRACNGQNHYLCSNNPDPCVDPKQICNGARNDVPAADDLCFGNLQVTSSWIDARDHCMNQNQTLFSPVNQQIQTAFQNEGYTVDVWIGINDEDVESSFIWTDGYYLSWANWKSGRPDGDSSDSGLGTGDDCAVLQTDGYWLDVNCDTSYNYVCMWTKGDVCGTAPEISNATKTVDSVNNKVTYLCDDGLTISNGKTAATFDCPCDGDWQTILGDMNCKKPKMTVFTYVGDQLTTVGVIAQLTVRHELQCARSCHNSQRECIGYNIQKTDANDFHCFLGGEFQEGYEAFTGKLSAYVQL